MFHTLKASSTLSGLNVSLREGTVFSENMSINNSGLVFNASGETAEKKQETHMNYDELSVNTIFKSNNNDVVTIENKLDKIGLSQTYSYTRSGILYRDGLEAFADGTILLQQTKDGGSNHRMFVTPSELNISTSNFSVANKGSVAVEGLGVTLNTSTSGLFLRGDMISLDSGGLLNKYLKVQIYDEVNNVYVPYVIPLMSAP
jgi:hypothetical protein